MMGTLSPELSGQLEEMNSYRYVFTAKTWRLCRTTVSTATSTAATKMPRYELTAQPFQSEMNLKEASNSAEFVSCGRTTIITRSAPVLASE
jgi:hypothetical protein